MGLLTASLARGPSRLRNPTLDRTSELLIRGLGQLGSAIQIAQSGGCIDVVGHGGYWASDDVEIDCGDQPAATALLLAACVPGRGRYLLTRAVVEAAGTQCLARALADLGLPVHIEHDPPRRQIRIGPSVFRGGQTTVHDPPAAVAVASLLLIAPCAAGDVFLEMPAWQARPPEVTLALRILEAFGIALVDDRATRIIIPAPQGFAAGEYDLQSLRSGHDPSAPASHPSL